MSKVLFLDIDGVVNCINTRQRHRGAIGIDPDLAVLIKKILIGVENLNVVLSSSWRCFQGGREEVENSVLPIYDVTPRINGERGWEIKKWLDDHPDVEKYAILDDDSDMLPSQLPNFFRTSWDTGITKEIVDKVINHLK